MTIQAVADHLRVGWDSIKDLFKRNLKIRFAEPKLKKLKRLAIDEISIGHGHRYLTVVLDLPSGAVVFIGKGKGADAWIPFWKRLKASHAKIEAIATDMSPAYTMAIRENLPKALHVFDHFPIVKLFNDRLSDFRRELFREAEGPLGKKVLKGTRWLILTRPSRGGVADQPTAGDGVLHEGRIPALLEPGKRRGRDAVSGRLVPPRRGIDIVGIEEDGEHLPDAPHWPIELPPLPHFDRPARGSEQQDQDAPAASLRLPRPRVLRATHLRNSQSQVRTCRMNQINVGGRHDEIFIAN